MKLEHWKQVTPLDQYTVIRGVLEGWISNLADGTTDKDKFVAKALELTEQLNTLEPFLRGKEKW